MFSNSRTIFSINYFTTNLLAASYPDVQMPLASRVVLQMDQAAPADQGILWCHRECGQDPNLDRHLRLRAGSYHQERLGLHRSLYTILQILSVTLFKKTPIIQALSHIDYEEPKEDNRNQLNLFQ